MPSGSAATAAAAAAARAAAICGNRNMPLIIAAVAAATTDALSGTARSRVDAGFNKGVECSSELNGRGGGVADSDPAGDSDPFEPHRATTAPEEDIVNVGEARLT